MDPPATREGTPATVQVVPYLDDHNGRQVGVVLIKERFVADQRGVAHRVGGATVNIADVLHDPEDAARSSIRLPSDLCLRKPSTDVVVVGSAICLGREPARTLDVHVTVGSIRKSLKVFGPRLWEVSWSGVAELSPPQPFTETALRWERAWGGSDYETDPEHPVEEPRNPVGNGVARDVRTLDGTLGPCIEDPANPIESTKTSPPPAGLGPIGRSWAPRRTFAGTYDDAWMEERMPLLPLDFDTRFNQFAPPDQIPPKPLRGGEPVEIDGMHEEGRVAFALPRLHFFVGVQTHEKLIESPTQLDAVLLAPNERAVEMTWRAIVALPRRPQDLRYIQVHEKRMLR